MTHPNVRKIDRITRECHAHLLEAERIKETFPPAWRVRRWWRARSAYVAEVLAAKQLADEAQALSDRTPNLPR